MPDSSAEADGSDHWWVPIAALAATLPVAVALTLALPPDAFAMVPVAVATLAGVVLALVSPAFVYLDRRYLAAKFEWTPSNWFYLMVALPVSPFVAAAYIYQRHEHVGVP